MTNERPFAKWDVWTATAFCVVLSAITFTSMLSTYARTGSDGPGGLTAFLCNLPMVFFFAAVPVRRAHERIKVLEDRLRLLEAAQAAR